MGRASDGRGEGARTPSPESAPWGGMAPHGTTDIWGMPAVIPPDVDCPLSGRSHAIKGRFPVQAERIINMTELKEIRCHKCGKLLAKGEILVIELKCPRCKAYNFLRAVSASLEPREGHKRDCVSDAR